MTTAPPRVSIISPVFNAERFLAEAVQSVLTQDYQDFELILVDDGSTDDSSAIARTFAKEHGSRVRYIEHPGRANRGISATRNLGLKAVRGELIAFIDADDRWRASKLREQVALLDRLPQVDALFGSVNYWSSWNGGTDRIYPTGHVRNEIIQPPQALLAWYPLGRAAAPSMSDLIVRRSAIAGAEFEESFTGLYEDHTFLAKLYLRAVIFVSTQVWSDYRQHGESCSSRLASEGVYEEVRRRFLDWLQAYLSTTNYADDLRLSLAVQRARLSARRGLISSLRSARRIVRDFARRE